MKKKDAVDEAFDYTGIAELVGCFKGLKPTKSFLL